MTHRPNRPRDANQLAKLIADLATGDAEDDQAPSEHDAQRRGGKKGGRARAGALTAEQRAEIARKAAQARWSKRGA